MEATDLMANDLVKVKPSGMVISVAAVHLKKVGYHAVTHKLNWVRQGLLSPIEITPEILEGNGFKKFDFHGIQGQHQWTWWYDTRTSVSLWCRELNDDPKDGWMIRIDSSLATCCDKIEHVHQLQQVLRLCHINKEILL